MADPPPVPEPLKMVWEAFLKLDAARSYAFGPNPISYADIWAFTQATSTPLSGWDVDLIRRLDQRILLVRAGKIADPSSIDGEPPKAPSLYERLRERARAQRGEAK